MVLNRIFSLYNVAGGLQHLWNQFREQVIKVIRWFLLEGRMLLHVQTPTWHCLWPGAPTVILPFVSWWFRGEGRIRDQSTCHLASDLYPLLTLSWWHLWDAWCGLVSLGVFTCTRSLALSSSGNQCWEQWITTQCNPDRHFQQSQRKSLYNFLTFI